MSPRVYHFMAAVLCLTPACSKQTARKDASPEAATAPAPRHNAAESLGFAGESSEGYFQGGNPSPAAAPPAPAATPASGTNKPIRHTLTAKDGRRVEAELLARSDTEVKFRRTSDSTEFTLPIDKLSAADQAFIRGSPLPPLAAR